MDQKNLSFEEQFQLLREEYAASLPGKFQEITSYWKTICENPEDTDALQAVLRLSHSLAGSGTSFGFTQITHISRALENEFRQLQQTDFSAQRQVVINELHRELGSHISTLPSAAPHLVACSNNVCVKRT